MYYTLGDYEKAIEDTKRAVEIDPSFVKAHFRQGLAQYELIDNPEAQSAAIECFRKAVQLEPASEEMTHMLQFAEEERKEDDLVPVQAEKDRFETLFRWMVDGGAIFDKLKLRYYEADYRGVHAARNVKKGETILYVPKQEIVTLEMAIDSPIGRKMFACGFRQRLISPKHSFLGTFLM